MNGSTGKPPASNDSRHALGSLGYRGGPPADELLGIAVSIYPHVVDLMLLGRGHWTGRGKWAARLVGRHLPELAEELAGAFATAVSGDRSRLLVLVDRELDRHGGRLFARYRHEAPLEARKRLPATPA